MKAFLVHEGMRCKQNYDEYNVSIVSNLEYEHCYSVNNSVVTYVNNGKVYVFPYSQDAIDELIGNGFKMAYMFVPFSNGDEPLENVEEYKAIFNK